MRRTKPAVGWACIGGIIGVISYSSYAALQFIYFISEWGTIPRDLSARRNNLTQILLRVKGTLCCHQVHITLLLHNFTNKVKKENMQKKEEVIIIKNQFPENEWIGVKTKLILRTSLSRGVWKLHLRLGIFNICLFYLYIDHPYYFSQFIKGAFRNFQ